MGANSKIELQVGADTQKAQASIAAFGNWLKSGFGLAVANRLTNALARIPEAIAKAVETGLKFNSTLEDAELGMAGLLRAIAPEKFATLDAALAASQGMMRDLRKEAETTAATFGQLVEASQGLMGPALTAGIPLEKMAKLASMIARTVGTVMPGAPGYQIMQEGRALLTGDIGPAAFVAKTIPGITKQAIDEATRAGRLFEFLEERLGAFNEVATRGAETFTVLTSNLKDAFEGVMGDSTKPLFDNLKSFLKDLRSLVLSPEFQRAVAILGNVASAGVETSSAMLRSTIAGGDAFAMTLAYAGNLGMALSSGLVAAGNAEERAFGRNLGEFIAASLAPRMSSPSTPGQAFTTQHWGTVGMAPAMDQSPSKERLADLVKSMALSTPKSGFSAAGLYLTRAEAHMQRQGLNLQKAMLDKLSQIEQRLAGRGLQLEW
jgi:hypothetical protein